MAAEVTNQVQPGDPLRQGDILQWEQQSDMPWTEYAIVVTADCDLVYNKNRNRISYVPVVRLETYVSSFWGPDYVAKKIAKICEAGTSAIQQAHKEKNGGEITRVAAMDWIQRDEPSKIVEALGVLEAKARTRFEQALAQAKLGLRCEIELAANAPGSEPYIKRLMKRSRELFPGGKGGENTIRDALIGHFSSLPGDVFFISQIPGEGEEGFFALLRHITQCDANDVSLDPVKRPGPVLPLRRTARLEGPFVYAMTQQLARVFSDIGLPDFRSDRLTESIKKYVS